VRFFTAPPSPADHCLQIEQCFVNKASLAEQLHHPTQIVVVVQMMTAPIRDQMYKAVTGFAIMACLAVACIHVPVQLAKAMSPGLFPLHLKVSGDRVLLDS
jgi:hypothetical protein